MEGKEVERGTSIEKIVEILEGLGHRLTPQRIIVAKIIMDNVKDHPSFKQIHQLATKQLPRLGVSTTYMIMKMLEEAGVITTFEANGETHIDSPHPHINIVCQDTGMIFDLEPNEESSEIVNAIINAARKQGVPLKKPVVVVKGFCTNGQKVKP
ncbi:MAG: transcriptional repressor [Desulfurococcales archaeon]|nr:transcriptional repressor [Desulfurococcales archaeon]MCE4622678.1 transcriptional repressor [Desulfurococcales archaeon]MCE4627068.1 transcriptional repressor [Desulfurococcales archaeon]